jgi:hypothetical protein
MALFIFLKNLDDVEGSLYKIASNQSFYDANKNWQDDLYDIITVNDDDYNAIKFGTKHVISKNGNTVKYENIDTFYENKEHLTSYINSVLSHLEQWLFINSSKPFASNVTTYLNYLKSIDVHSLSITKENPLNSSLEAYVENQGITAIHLLELL